MRIPIGPVIELLRPYVIVWLTDRPNTEGDLPGVADRRGETMYPITGQHISALQEHRYGRATVDTAIPGVKASAMRRTVAAMASIARRPVGASTRSSRGVQLARSSHRPIEHH